MIDPVHISEIIVGAHAVLGHHAAHGGAVAAVIILLDHARLLGRNLQPGTDELADPRIDLLPQIDVMRIQRVVEIEHPGVDVGEGAGCIRRAIILSLHLSLAKAGDASTAVGDRYSSRAIYPTSTCGTRVNPSLAERGTRVPGGVCARSSEKFHHGIAKRSVLPPPLMSTAAKPVTVRPRLPQSFWSLISNLLSRVQSCVAPPQFSGLSLNLSARFSPSTASAKLKICLGWPDDVGMQAFAGIDAIPAAADHGLAVVGADRGHDLVRRVVAPGQPGGRGRLHRVDHGGEEIRRLHDIGGQSAIFQEGRQRCLRLRAVDAVDRRRVIARDHQQPLNAGEPRLLVVIFAVLGQIRHQMAVVGPGRVDLGERRRGLSGAALAGRRNDEIVRRDAQRVVAALRHRRRAVDAERAGIEQDAVGGQRALRDHAAGRRIDPEPAARRGGGLVVDADRDLDHIAHAVAELQVGIGRCRRKQE